MTQPRLVSFFDHTAVTSGGELAMFNLLGVLNPQRWRSSVILGQPGPHVTRLQREGRAVLAPSLDLAADADDAPLAGPAGWDWQLDRAPVKL